jgi:DNA primase
MSYDMSGFDYGILDVVQVLHLRKRRGNYYDCPFCGETKGKLNINVEKNVFRCNRCDASGGMLKLYADLYNVTLSEANQQIREALGKGEFRTDYVKVTPAQEEIETAELAPIEEIHRTYRKMLSMLTLSKKHQEDLLGRGLKPEQIEAQRYRSVPLFGVKKMTRRLIEEGCTVKGVLSGSGWNLDGKLQGRKFRNFDSYCFAGWFHTGFSNPCRSCDRYQKVYLAFQCVL